MACLATLTPMARLWWVIVVGLMTHEAVVDLFGKLAEASASIPEMGECERREILHMPVRQFSSGMRAMEPSWDASWCMWSMRSWFLSPSGVAWRGRVSVGHVGQWLVVRSKVDLVTRGVTASDAARMLGVRRSKFYDLVNASPSLRACRIELPRRRVWVVAGLEAWSGRRPPPP